MNKIMEYVVWRFQNGELTVSGAIYELLSCDNTLSFIEMSKLLGCSEIAVHVSMVKLKKSGRVVSHKNPSDRKRNVYETFSYEQIHQDRTGRQSDASSVP